MILYIIRHAWAGQADETRWPDDGQRPLTAKGQKRFARLVRRLAKRGLAPELIASSPLVRCRQTAELVAAGTEQPPVVLRLELAPGGNLEDLLAWTAQAAGACTQVAWVGHAPEVGTFTAALIGSAGGQIQLAKGAVVRVEFEGPPQLGQGHLSALLTAKLLGV